MAIEEMLLIFVISFVLATSGIGSEEKETNINYNKIIEHNQMIKKPRSLLP